MCLQLATTKFCCVTIFEVSGTVYMCNNAFQLAMQRCVESCSNLLLLLHLNSKNNFFKLFSDDLWGSESEDENSEILLNSQMLSKISFSPPIAKTSLPTTSCNIAKNMNLEIRIGIDKKDDKEQDKMFSSPKSFIKVENDPVSSDTLLTSQFYTSRNQFPFTQWFQDQVDTFCNSSSEIKKSDLMKDILSSAPYGYLSSPKSEQYSFKQESSLMVQFSQWFNQQVKTLSSQSSSSENNGSQENWTDFPNKISNESFAFTQWFEENLEKYLKS